MRLHVTILIGGRSVVGTIVRFRICINTTHSDTSTGIVQHSPDLINGRAPSLLSRILRKIGNTYSLKLKNDKVVQTENKAHENIKISSFTKNIKYWLLFTSNIVV